MKKYELEKLTKAQLVEKCLENQHLATTVEAKDQEISDLKKKHIEEKEKIKKDYENGEITNIKKGHADDLKRMDVQLQNKDKEIKALIAEIEKRDEKVETFYDLARKAIDRHIAMTKVIEGTADSNAELLEYANIILNSHLPKKQN